MPEPIESRTPSPALMGAFELLLPWALTGLWGLVCLPVLLPAGAVLGYGTAVFPLLLGIAALLALAATLWRLWPWGRARRHGITSSAWHTQGVPFAGVAGISHPGSGARILFRAGRHPWLALGCGLLGLGLGAAAAWLATAGGESLSLGEGYRALLAAHFALAGFAALLTALYQLCNTLEVLVDRGRLRVLRRCLGLTFSRREFSARSLRSFQVGGLSQLHGENRFGHYHIRALLEDGRRVTVGESLGRREAAVALGQHLSDWIGLHGRAARRGRRLGEAADAPSGGVGVTRPLPI